MIRSSTSRLLLLLAILAAPLAGQIPDSEFEERRARLAAQIENGVILALGSTAPPQDYIPYFQNSAFRYLTGFMEPDAALLIVVTGGRAEAELFVNPRDPARETWEGYRVGPERVQAAFGVRGRAVSELEEALASALVGRRTLQVVAAFQPGATVLNHDTQRLRALLETSPEVDVRPITGRVAELREVKSAAELDLMSRSMAITVAAHREVLGALTPGMNEFEVQALVEYTFRRYGSERPAFVSIVGSGPNSTILHYNRNDRFMEAGDMVVVDVGASYGGYAADITRTLPVSGRFTPEQREIYQIVRDAQAAAEEAAELGGRRGAMGEAADRVLAEGLTRVGLIEAPDATYDCGAPERLRSCPQLGLFYMHGLGHGIGLDVHDPWPATLEPGAVFSIEPGIYVRSNLFSEVVPDTPRNRALHAAIREAFARYRNIGVRIEDDYMVTREGVEWMTRAPREIDEIEALMAAPRSGVSERNAEWVEWYRRLH